jgi:hypothetical protein
MHMSARTFAGALGFVTSMLVVGPALADPPAASGASDSNLGGPGESCRARTDCRKGLKCRSNVCADEREGESCGATSDCGGELKCISNVCTSPLGNAAPSGGGGGDSGWMRFKLDGLHPFVGTAFLGGPNVLVSSGIAGFGGGSVVDTGFNWVLRGGVYINKNEIALEISPGSYVATFPSAGVGFQFNVSYGYLFTLSESSSGASAYWPIRIGVGMVAGNGASPAFQGRVDLVGIAIKIGHVIVDLYSPSFRFTVANDSGVTAGFLSWDFGAGASYLF